MNCHVYRGLNRDKGKFFYFTYPYTIIVDINLNNITINVEF